MIEFEFKFEFTALFKIYLKQTYPNEDSNGFRGVRRHALPEIF